jgi:2,3-bisphosphoglycerate-independent phosphoglycerate mutase
LFMKYLIILADGAADYSIAELDNKTPLQYAQTPNIDKLARSGDIGLVQTIPEGFPPGSDVANLSVMGFDPRRYYTGRSPLEAVSMGVKLGDQDMALRCNLVCLSPEGDYPDKIMQDYSAGEISTEESGKLMAELQAQLGDDEFSFHAGISYRHLVVWKNGADKDVKLTPPHDISDRVVGEYLPKGRDASKLLQLMMQSQEILKNHPVNRERIEKGQIPATSVWFWGEGRRPSLPTFEEKYGLKGSVVCAVDLVRGLGICAGLNPVKVAGATGSVETNFAGKARAALDELKRGQDFVFLHIESPDEAGHQGNLKSKLWSIEKIDKEVVGLLLEEMDDFDQLRVMLLPDHRTPISIRTHSSEPVPFLIYDKNNPLTDGAGKYDEESALQGPFVAEGCNLMDRFIRGE